MPRHHSIDPPAPATPAPIGDDLQSAADAFVGPGHRLESIGGRPHLIRTDVSEGDVRIARWRPGTSSQRVDFASRLRQTLITAEIEGIGRPVPTLADGTPFLEIDGRFYDAQSWLPGRPAGRWQGALTSDGRSVRVPGTLPGNGLREAAERIAQMHLAADALVDAPTPPLAPLSVVLKAIADRWQIDRGVLRPAAPAQPHIQRWVKVGEQVLPAAEEVLTKAGFLADLRPVVAHFNIWPGHLLFHRQGGDERLTGLLDFSEAALSSPLVDIGQIVTHGSGWTGDSAEDALSAYASVRPLTPDERRLLPAVAGLDLVAETGRLLTVAYGRGVAPEVEAAEAARSGAAALLLSLEALLPAIKRASETSAPSKTRPWVRRSRPNYATTERAARPKSPRGGRA